MAHYVVATPNEARQLWNNCFVAEKESEGWTCIRGSAYYLLPVKTTLSLVRHLDNLSKCMFMEGLVLFVGGWPVVEALHLHLGRDRA